MEDDARDPSGLSELGVAGRCSTGIDASTPAAWLEVLARDENEEVRLWTACNPALPEQLRRELMGQRESMLFVRCRSVSPDPRENWVTPCWRRF